MWKTWLQEFDNYDLNSQILSTINILVQNVKDKGHLAYILKHELLLALILYKPNFAERAGLGNQ